MCSAVLVDLAVLVGFTVPASAGLLKSVVTGLELLKGCQLLASGEGGT
jgi:hypothetical protein